MKKIRMIAASIVMTLSWESAYAAIPALRSDVTTPVRHSEFSAEDVLGSHSGLREKLLGALRDDPKVATELGKMGVKRSEVERRLAAMTDDELQQIQNGVQRQAGGGRRDSFDDHPPFDHHHRDPRRVTE